MLLILKAPNGALGTERVWLSPSQWSQLSPYVAQGKALVLAVDAGQWTAAGLPAAALAAK